MINLDSCPVCKSDRVTQYNKVGLAPHVSHEIMPGVMIDAVIVTRYFTCQNCGLIFQNPRMSNRDLDNFYSKGFYRKTLNLTDVEKDDDEEDRAKIDSGIIKNHIGKVKSHLDIGASRGFLLNEVGADTKVAVESDIIGFKEKGIKIYKRMQKVPQKLFDLVTAIHALEHVPDPVNYLKNMAKFINKDGYLVIEVPTWKSLGGPLRLAHLSHFEPGVLRRMCIETGLTIVYEEFTPHFLIICKKSS